MSANQQQELGQPEVLALTEVGQWEVEMSPKWSGELVKALASAQLKFKPVFKQSDNPAFMRGGKASKYADLAEYIDATQEALAENGLVLSQWPCVALDAKSVTVASYLLHTSGEWMRGKLTLPAVDREGFTAQTCGKAITYGRRYSYSAITGCASEDDDGNAVSGRGTSEAAQEVAKGKLEKAAKSSDPKIKKLAEEGLQSVESCLFYLWHDESQTAEITGAESLKTANKDLLKPLWSAAARAIICNADQLEALKYELEQRKVLFRPLKAAS